VSLNDLIPPSWLFAIGWTLLHSIWQGAVIAGVCKIGLRLLSHASANARYLFACASLFAMPALGAATFVRVINASSGQGDLVAAVLQTLLGGPPAERLVVVFASAERVMPAIVAVWMVGVLGLSIRLVGGWAYLAWMCRRLCAPAGACWQALVRDLSRHMALATPVTVLRSRRVQVPMTVGWLEPVIVMPAALLTATPIDQIRAVLLHELAHIRRHDYLVNLVQSAIEVLFFYHPAAWWLSGRIRVERECCCDDLAVHLCGDARLYRRTLLELEERRVGLILAARSNGGSLGDRVRRLALGRPQSSRSANGRGARLGLALGPFLLAGWLVTLGLPPTDGRVDSSGRALMISALCDAHGEGARGCRDIEMLVEAFSDPRPGVRRLAVRVLEASRNPRAVPALTLALRDADAGVRRDAAEALDALEDGRAVDPLVVALQEDAVEAVRREAAEALGEIGDRRAVQPLVAALSDASADVRRETADALGSLKDRRAVPGLLGVARDAMPEVRLEAARALGELGDPRAAQVLRRLLADPHPNVRSAAVRALSQLDA
jgi:beta-lactamase regulating signal transducer with metallopeptidase domain